MGRKQVIAALPEGLPSFESNILSLWVNYICAIADLAYWRILICAFMCSYVKR